MPTPVPIQLLLPFMNRRVFAPLHEAHYFLVRLRKTFGDVVVAALAMPHAALVAATEVNAERHARKVRDDRRIRLERAREILRRVGEDPVLIEPQGYILGRRRLKGGDDTTFTAIGLNGSWSLYASMRHEQYGISLSGKPGAETSGATVKGCRVSRFRRGIRLQVVHVDVAGAARQVHHDDGLVGGRGRDGPLGLPAQQVRQGTAASSMPRSSAMIWVVPLKKNVDEALTKP
jgi:hypothetical protein